MGAAVGLLLLAVATHAGAEETNRRAIDVDEQGPNGQHKIFWRIQGLEFDKVGDFLDAGVDIETRGFRGATPVIWAALSGSWVMALFLIERGADLSASDRDGITVCRIQEGKPTRLDTENGRALEEVRRILEEKGTCEGGRMTS